MGDTICKASGYFREAMAQDLRTLVRNARALIPSDVDTIVGTGLSGTLVVPHLGRRLGLAWGIVRKETDLQGSNSHASEMYEGTMGRRWALVDDFMSSGRTLKRTMRQVHETFRRPHGEWWMRQWDTEFVGLYQYVRPRNTPWMPVSLLTNRDDWRYVPGIREWISTAHPSTEDPGAELPPAGRLQAVPSAQSPESEGRDSPLRVPCSPFPAL